ncbi:cupin, partial [Streptomyces sp. NRRL F-6602]
VVRTDGEMELLPGVTEGAPLPDGLSWLAGATAEVAADTPGQQVVLDRLLDWMLVCALREYFDRPGGTPPGWYSAGRDPVVGGALLLLHAEPAAPWTVASLACRTGVSRATLA